MSDEALKARLPLLERDEAAEELQPLYDKLLVERGVVPNMFKALANVPGLPQGVAAFLKPLLSDGALAGWYKELLSIRVASLNDCEYCVSAHRYSAKQKGASAGQIEGVDNFESGPFTEREKAGFRYAELLHASGHAIDDAAYAAASAHFNAAELIELTMVAAAFEMFPRFNTAFRIPVTKLPE
jgi:uncharacterized peroxidase-related enzyme